MGKSFSHVAQKPDIAQEPNVVHEPNVAEEANLAGSAIAQGPSVGRIDKWSQWNPTSIEPKWLLLSGASDPPSCISISDRRTRDVPGVRSGTFLPGVTRDLINVEDAVRPHLFNTVKDLYQTKSSAIRHIRELFDTCTRQKIKPILYYTGHGEEGTGNWCFADAAISIQEILDMASKGGHYPMIFSDACYSGHWANFCLEKNIAGFHCLAACPEYSTAIDTEGEGGDLTLFMTGKKPRPSTEPIYSGGNREDFPYTHARGDGSYTDFIGSHIQNSETDILICQSFHNECFSGCFATSERYNPRPAHGWGIRNTYDSFLKLVKKQGSKSKQIYSFACDENLGFGAFFMENYGTSQTIVTNLSEIDDKQTEGFQITACAARGSTFYIIMTKDTEEYKGKQQTWFTGRKFASINNEIWKLYLEGNAITGICYSTGLRQYFVVMTNIPGRKTWKWFDDPSAANGWAYSLYHPIIIFKDPTDKKILIVMTTYNPVRRGYKWILNKKLK